MKKIVLYSLFMAIISLSSCLKEDYIKYDESLKDAIYLSMKPETDSLFYNFGFTSITEATLFIEVKVMGLPRNYDRKFELRTVNDKYSDYEFLPADPSYYEIPEFVTVPAGELSVMVPLKLFRNKELEETRAIITVELLPGKDFDIRGHDECTFTFDDMMPNVPAWWYMQERGLGEFTKIKYTLFLESFWELKESDPLSYKMIIDKFGIELNQIDDMYQSPFNDFPVIMVEKIVRSLYEYQLANPGVISGICKPEDYWK